MQFLFLSLLLAAGLCSAEISIFNQPGIGARSYGLANNFVALSNDQSGLFWNPGGIGFIPAREFQFSVDGLSQKTSMDFFSTSNSSELQRPRLVNFGYLHAFPTVQGGFVMAAALQNPYTFDDVRKFGGGYTDTGGNSVSVSRFYKAFGSLHLWTGGFGLQVAEGFSLGAAISYVSGGEDDHDVFLKKTAGKIVDIYGDDYDQTISRSYSGYDIRFGFLYTFVKNWNVGMRIVLPQTIWFTEDASETYPHSPSEPQYTETREGKLFSSYSSALGVSGTFPFMTVATELRFRAPYTFTYPAENIPDTSIAAKTRVGAGIGVEVPLARGSTLLRAGYSWDQFDTYLFTKKYDDATAVNWDAAGEAPDGGIQLVTFGVAFIIQRVCLEASYGYSFWKLNTNGHLDETHSQHRFLASLSYRF
jgi:hypothetical protein